METKGIEVSEELVKKEGGVEDFIEESDDDNKYAQSSYVAKSAFEINLIQITPLINYPLINHIILQCVSIWNHNLVF